MSQSANVTYGNDHIGESLSGQEIVEDWSQVAMSRLEENTSMKPSRKPLSFYLAFLSLNMSVLIVSLDVTVLPVAVPVCANSVFSMRVP